MSYIILVINPGSTSTKIGLFENDKEIFSKSLRHSAEELEKFHDISSQMTWRKQLVEQALKDNHFDICELSAVCARGGVVAPISGGTYITTPRMVDDCAKGIRGQHASNLGAQIASCIGEEYGIPSYVVDPPVVDELWPEARYTGHPAFARHCRFHALNQRAVAKRYAKEIGKPYDSLNLIVCHMGGGISVGAHVQGRIVDAPNCLDGEGPFSPERAGALPTGQLIDMCFSGKYTQKEMRDMIAGRGGLVAYLGSTNMKQLLIDAETDLKIAEVMEAFHYQISKEIGAVAAAMCGKVDQIILTGGVAYGPESVEAISKRVSWIAPITVYPGEDELLALAEGALRVLTGEEQAKIY